LAQLGQWRATGAQNQNSNVPTETKWDIKPSKIYSGIFETSLNGPGFSITLCNLTAAAREGKSSFGELEGLLSAETRAPAWPNVWANGSTKGPRREIPKVDIEKQTEVSASEDIKGIVSFAGGGNKC
jgi:triose/dihydroxyacetone kinase / FAD-AMP lyase (cyclizing)